VRPGCIEGVVAGRDHAENAVLVGALDGALHRRAAARSAEAHVEHGGIVLNRISDRADDQAVEHAVPVAHTERHDLDVRQRRVDDDAGHMGPVPASLRRCRIVLRHAVILIEVVAADKPA